MQHAIVGFVKPTATYDELGRVLRNFPGMETYAPSLHFADLCLDYQLRRDSVVDSG